MRLTKLFNADTILSGIVFVIIFMLIFMVGLIVLEGFNAFLR